MGQKAAFHPSRERAALTSCRWVLKNFGGHSTQGSSRARGGVWDRCSRWNEGIDFCLSRCLVPGGGSWAPEGSQDIPCGEPEPELSPNTQPRCGGRALARASRRVRPRPRCPLLAHPARARPEPQPLPSPLVAPGDEPGQGGACTCAGWRGDRGSQPPAAAPRGRCSAPWGPEPISMRRRDRERGLRALGPGGALLDGAGPRSWVVRALAGRAHHAQALRPAITARTGGRAARLPSGAHR